MPPTSLSFDTDPETQQLDTRLFEIVLLERVGAFELCELPQTTHKLHNAVGQPQTAQHWQTAHYDPDFRKQLGLPPEKPKKPKP